MTLGERLRALVAGRGGAPAESCLISAGFDAHRDDPLAHINLNEGDFAWVTEEILTG